MQPFTADLFKVLERAGRPPTSLPQECECSLTLSAGQLANLANSTANQPDSQIESDSGLLVGAGFADAQASKSADEALPARGPFRPQSSETLRKLAAGLLHAQEEERRRIAREMHDDWTQRLALLGIDLAKLEKCIGTPEKSLPLLRAMQEELVSLCEDVHALSRQLHPSIIEDLGLVEALRSECASFSHREGIQVVYRPDEAPVAMPKDVALCVYRIAQEALRNLAKHAAVREAHVTLSVAGAELLLRVEDSGIGFDPAGTRSQPGLGLTSMVERARLIQAELLITSAPGQGTTVEVRAPCGGAIRDLPLPEETVVPGAFLLAGGGVQG
jgi:two-component system, NarL family, sensor kinase